MHTEIDNPLALPGQHNWAAPCPHTGSGHDPRSSENGLLAIMYANLEHSARLNWLNAGRTLVDKTYINILWQTAGLPAIGVPAHNIASDLDAFIRHHLQPVWDEIEQLDHADKHQLAITLVELAADTVFGSGYQEQAASWVLYYLCPQLPIFPLSDQLCRAMGIAADGSQTSYADYHQACRQQFSHLLPRIHSPIPSAQYGSEREIDIINQLLRGSDWWQRRCFIHYLLN